MAFRKTQSTCPDIGVQRAGDFVIFQSFFVSHKLFAFEKFRFVFPSRLCFVSTPLQDK